MEIIKNNGNKNFIINLNSNFDNLGFYKQGIGDINIENEIVYYVENEYTLAFEIGKIKENINKIIIDWGDNETSEYTNQKIVKHLYSVKKKYIINIFIETDFDNFYINKVIDLNQPNQLRTTDFYLVNLTNGLTAEENEHTEYNNYKISSINIRFMGIGKSRLNELYKYGNNNYEGVVEEVYNEGVKGLRYVIDGLTYIDYEDGLTHIEGVVRNSSFNEVKEGFLVRDELLLGFVEEPIIQSDVYIDRGKQNVIEKNLRLCEVDNIRELMQYGNGYFNIRKM